MRDWMGAWHSMSTTIRLVAVPCNFGGERHWFLCPHCRGRAAVLYENSNSHFVCRRCSNLAYASQNESDIDRQYRKVRGLRARLGASMNLLEPVIWNPRGCISGPLTGCE